jgi:hypothetical protein
MREFSLTAPADIHRGDIVEISLGDSSNPVVGLVNEIFHNELIEGGIIGIIDGDGRARFFAYTRKGKGKLVVNGKSPLTLVVKGGKNDD